MFHFQRTCENLPKKNCLNQLLMFRVLNEASLSLLLLRDWAELKPSGIDYVFKALYLQERTEPLEKETSIDTVLLPLELEKT